MTNEKKSRDRTAAVVFVVFAANAATAFAIQAWMTFGFGAKVWGMPTPLCVSLVVALDVFAIMFMVLTYLLRGTGWPRGAAMVVFLFAVGAQVFAAEQYGRFERWEESVRWFSALPAVFLALAQEGVILWRTHRNRQRKASPLVAAPVPVRKTDRDHSGKAPAVQHPPRLLRPVSPPAVPPVSSGLAAEPTQPQSSGRGRRVDPEEQARRDQVAADVLARGADAAAKRSAADAAGVSVRSIENWITSYSERQPAPQLHTRTFAPLETAREQQKSTEEVKVNGTQVS